MRGRMPKTVTNAALIPELWIGRQRDHDGGDAVQQPRGKETRPDRTAGGGVAVDLGEDVAKDVGDGEQDHCPRGRHSVDAYDLLREQV